MLCVSGSRREEYGLSYSSDDDLSSLAVDAEHHVSRFVAKTLRVIGFTNVLDLGTEAVVVAVTGEVNFDNQNKR